MNCFDYPLDPAYLLQKKRSLKRQLLEKQGLIEKKVAIMSGSTIGEIKNILELFLLENGIKPTFHEGAYALFYENLVFDDGSLKAFAPDVIYIHTSVRNIKLWPDASDEPSRVEEKLNAEYSRFEQAIRAALSFGCPVIANNFDLPVYRVMGNREGVDCHGRVRFVRQLNEKLAALAEATPNLYLNDLAYLQAVHGMDVFSSQTAWYAYKYAVSIDCIPYLCQSVANIIKSLLGKNKKALALDLDNTLWGGIIGDDGPEGIVMGNETPAGMAYAEFQSYLKELSKLGILLNVCSKNEEKIALTGFERADTVLKRDDFLCFKANWEPKSRNIAAMAQEINILPESFVFVDDNPAEREIVRQELPGVTVPELGAPEEYIAAIDRSGYFEVTTLSADDKKRAEMYKQNAQRAAAESAFTDYNDYLLSLEMTGEIGPFSTAHCERITQLINKTNQFNFTTRRYAQSEVEEIIADRTNYISAYAKLIDKFGDNGITTCLIASVEGTNANIDLWVMSCRVFKRHLEYAVFDYLIAKCKEMGVKTITASYLPTAKNVIIKDFYEGIGFDVTLDSESEKRYILNIPEEYENKNKVIKMEIV